MKGLSGKILLISCLTFLVFNLPNTVIADHIKINEVYFDVDSTHGAETSNEWIELYNLTSTEITLVNWIIEDNVSSDILPTTTIGANSALLIAADESTFSFWTIPSTKIFLGGSIGNGLGNGGDKLILKDESGAIHDQLSYGDVSSPDPHLELVSFGHSLERTPVGGTFIDQSNPTPGSLTSTTPTPSPTISPTPTKTPTPTPTKTPTPQLNPTSPPTPTSTSSQLSPILKPTQTPAPKKSPTPTVVISQEILGLTNISPTIEPETTPYPTPETKVAALSFQNITMFSIGILIVLIASLSSTFLFKRSDKI